MIGASLRFSGGDLFLVAVHFACFLFFLLCMILSGYLLGSSFWVHRVLDGVGYCVYICCVFTFSLVG